MQRQLWGARPARPMLHEEALCAPEHLAVVWEHSSWSKLYSSDNTHRRIIPYYGSGKRWVPAFAGTTIGDWDDSLRRSPASSRVTLFILPAGDVDPDPPTADGIDLRGRRREIPKNHPKQSRAGEVPKGPKPLNQGPRFFRTGKNQKKSVDKMRKSFYYSGV